MINTKLLMVNTCIVSLFLWVQPAYAHVVVRPNEVGVAAYQTFTVGVPNEKDNPTLAVTLVMPEGLKSVTPNVKPGWTINVKKTGEGEEAIVTEINWTGGTIPVGQRDEFLFSAQVPSTETKLLWKAYQTYQNGDVVSWDQDPKSNMSHQESEEMEHSGKGPYSETKIVNDLKGTTQSTELNSQGKDSSKVALVLSMIALFVSIIALKNKKIVV